MAARSPLPLSCSEEEELECKLSDCLICSVGGPIANNILHNTSWTSILKLVLSVLHHCIYAQDFFSNNEITLFVKVHWGQISGSKKWTDEYKSRVSDCLSHNPKCFESKERGKWRLKDRVSIPKLINKLKRIGCNPPSGSPDTPPPTSPSQQSIKFHTLPVLKMEQLVLSSSDLDTVPQIKKRKLEKDPYEHTAKRTPYSPGHSDECYPYSCSPSVYHPSPHITTRFSLPTPTQYEFIQYANVNSNTSQPDFYSACQQQPQYYDSYDYHLPHSSSHVTRTHYQLHPHSPSSPSHHHFSSYHNSPLSLSHGSLSSHHTSPPSPPYYHHSAPSSPHDSSPSTLSWSPLKQPSSLKQSSSLTLPSIQSILSDLGPSSHLWALGRSDMPARIAV